MRALAEVDETRRLELADLIKKKRLAKGLGLDKLSTRAEIQTTVLLRIERGEVLKINPFFLQRIADVLGLDYKELFTIAGYIREEDYDKRTKLVHSEPLILDLPIYGISKEGYLKMGHEISYKKILKDGLSSKTFGVKITGDFLKELGEEEEIAIFDPLANTDFGEKDDEVYQIKYKNKNFIRRISFVKEKMVVLRSLNSKYKDFYVEGEDINDLILIGKLVKIIKEISF